MPDSPLYAVRLDANANKMLTEIKDQRVQNLIVKRAEQLAIEPGKQGKPLSDDLAGCRSVRAVGQRYRIIYQVEEETVIVLVVALGIRKEGDKRDIYTVAAKMAAQGLLNPPAEAPEN